MATLRHILLLSFVDATVRQEVRHCSYYYTSPPACGGSRILLNHARALNAMDMTPLTAGAANSSAWGFTTAYDPADQMYHAVVDVSCGCGAHSAVRECTEFTGVLASGGYASTLVHVQSSRPDADFRLVSVIAPPTSFNPHLVSRNAVTHLKSK